MDHYLCMSPLILDVDCHDKWKLHEPIDRLDGVVTVAKVGGVKFVQVFPRRLKPLVVHDPPLTPAECPQVFLAHPDPQIARIGGRHGVEFTLRGSNTHIQRSVIYSTQTRFHTNIPTQRTFVCPAASRTDQCQGNVGISQHLGSLCEMPAHNRSLPLSTLHSIETLQRQERFVLINMRTKHLYSRIMQTCAHKRAATSACISVCSGIPNHRFQSSVSAAEL